MKKMIFVAGSLLLNFQAFAQASQAAYFSCSVSGKNVVKTRALEDLGVTSVAPSTIAVALSENLASGSYMTYLHLTLSLKGEDLSLSTSIEPTKVQKILKGKDSFKVMIQSRLDSIQSMEVNVECAPSYADYLLVPNESYDNSALNGLQNVPETMSSVVSHLDDARFNLTSSASISEFLAAHFCLTGSSEKALSDIQEQSALVRNFWRRKALNVNQVIAPLAFRAENGSISWEQPYDSARCVKSHHETYEDQDGMDQDVTVCDEYKVTQEAPLSLTIPACSKK
ncbi:MAG: hypothetical protein ACXVCE_05810 [Bacteriovorax sp.]